MTRHALYTLFFLALIPVDSASAQDAMHRIPLGGGDTIAVVQGGSGPVVVLIPGLLGGAFSYRKVLPALHEAGMSTLVIEPLGVGFSSRPGKSDYSLEAQAARVERVLEELQVDSAIFVCHSVGGSICYRLALRAPARVRGIVGLNAGPDERAATSGLRMAMRFAPLVRVMGTSAAKRRIREGVVDSSADPAWVTGEVMEAYTRPFSDLGSALTGLRGMASAKDAEPLVPRLPNIRAPVRLLISTGGKKSESSEAGIQTLKRGIPDITVEQVANAGQYIQEEAPGAVIEAVAALRAYLGRGRQRMLP